MNTGGGGCGEPRECHCTSAWVTEQASVSKMERKRERKEVGRRERKERKKRKERREGRKKGEGKEKRKGKKSIIVSIL